MCGIAGFITPGGAEGEGMAETINRMTDMIRHRGPNAGGLWLMPPEGVALGHRRLSIVDLSSAGAQPMMSASGRYVVVYNGEIYNFLDLRREMGAAGRTFRGGSDTEIILAAIEEWGLARALARFIGMFAIALYDTAEKTLHLARDPAGKKPLYFGYTGRTFAFASELKALTVMPGFERRVSARARALFLEYNFIPAPHTIYEGFYKLAPGTCLSLTLADIAAGRDAARFTDQAWPHFRPHELTHQVRPRVPEEESLQELEEALSLAVAQRMIADVPLGAFLSGGVDSALITALMQKNSPRPVKTFSIAFEEDAFDESPHAAAVARHLGTDHTVFRVGAEEARGVIPHLADIYDEPFADSSQIPTWHVCRLARENVTVALTGDGGDEMFGGYNRYRLAQRLANIVPVSSLVLRPSVARLLADFTGPQNLRRAWGLLAAGSREALYQAFLRVDHRPPLRTAENTGAVFPALADIGRTPGRAIEDDMMAADLSFYLPDDILAKADRASMAHGLELRAPFLDRRVMEYAWRLPPPLRLEDGQGKRILRRLLARHVPPALFDRPKQGFSVPLASWLRGPLRPWMEDMLASARLREQGILDAARVERRVRQHLSGRYDWSYSLWGLLMLQSWHERWMKP